MERTDVRLKGAAARGTRISASVLRDLLDTLLEGARKTVRLRIEGRSVARGTPPGWLEDAAAFELVEMQEGSTIVALEAEPISRAVPEQYLLGDLFSDASNDGEKTGLAHFFDGLDAALSGNSDSDLYDEGLISTFESFERLFKHGFDEIEVVNGRALTIDSNGLERVGQLKRSIPRARRVRLAGQLDQIRHSDRMFTLVLEDGSRVKGLANDIAANELASLFGKQATVSGVAHFKPSGLLQRIDAELIAPSAGDVELWSKAPTPLFEDRHVARELRQPQGPISGFAAVIGKWPGDEDDETIDEALRTL